MRKQRFGRLHPSSELDCAFGSIKEPLQERHSNNIEETATHLLSSDCALAEILKAAEEPARIPQVEKSAQNIQEAFLNNTRKDKTFLTIYLMSGVKLSGRIKSFDKYSVILETNNQEQLIFKHAISTVVISKPAHASVHAAAGFGPAVPGVPANGPEPEEESHS